MIRVAEFDVTPEGNLQLKLVFPSGNRWVTGIFRDPKKMVHILDTLRNWSEETDKDPILNIQEVLN